MKRPPANKRVAVWLCGYIERELRKALSEAKIPARVMAKVYPVWEAPHIACSYLHSTESDYLAMTRCTHIGREWDYAVKCSIAGPWHLKRQANELITKFVSNVRARINSEED